MRNGVLIHFPAKGSRFGGLYHHCELALAEGFRALGIPVFGTHAYWRDHPAADFTIAEAPADFAPDIHLHTAYDLAAGHAPDESFRLRGLHVVLDWNDGEGAWLAKPSAGVPDLILRSHFRDDLGYPANVRPWAFGLTHRLIDTLALWPPDAPGLSINWNFRHDHNLRRLVRRSLPAELLGRYPLATQTDSLDPTGGWLHQQTCGRHHLNYFQNLHTHRLTAAFGGNFRLRGPVVHRLTGRITRRTRGEIVKLRLKLKRVTAYDDWLDFIESHPGIYHVIQSDSWRWWESLLSASVPLHLDLDSHGWKLPVMPVNGLHYLGLRNWDYAQLARDVLARDAASFSKLAETGRDWAIKHYSPAAAAARLLDWLGLLAPDAARPTA